MGVTWVVYTDMIFVSRPIGIKIRNWLGGGVGGGIVEPLGNVGFPKIKRGWAGVTLQQ